jgi:hypothetical protein
MKLKNIRGITFRQQVAHQLDFSDVNIEFVMVKPVIYYTMSCPDIP